MELQALKKVRERIKELEKDPDAVLPRVELGWAKIKIETDLRAIEAKLKEIDHLEITGYPMDAGRKRKDLISAIHSALEGGDA